jgi:hypothetical protein
MRLGRAIGVDGYVNGSRRSWSAADARTAGTVALARHVAQGAAASQRLDESRPSITSFLR